MMCGAQRTAIVRDVRPQRVEIVIGARTLATLAAFGLLVALALLSLGTLISILLAAVLALGLDPIVAGLVARGWKRGRAALAVFGGLFAAVFILIPPPPPPRWRGILHFVHPRPGPLGKKPGKGLVKKLLHSLRGDGK